MYQKFSQSLAMSPILATLFSTSLSCSHFDAQSQGPRISYGRRLRQQRGQRKRQPDVAAKTIVPVRTAAASSLPIVYFMMVTPPNSWEFSSKHKPLWFHLKLSQPPLPLPQGTILILYLTPARLRERLHQTLRRLIGSLRATKFAVEYFPSRILICGRRGRKEGRNWFRENMRKIRKWAVKNGVKCGFHC
jgi:hypothetical protein